MFLKGCPLRCWWCHNPEGLIPQPEVIVIENRCIGCGKCREVCRSGAVVEKAEHGTTKCTVCGCCVAACPTGARQLVGRKMTVDAVIAEVLRDRLFYDDSGGGVTFSGGEPLAQPSFLKELLETCRTHGIHTAVDTCGYAQRESLLAVAPVTDLFLYDLKIMDDARHREYTSASNAAILENLRALGEVHHNIWIRVPIIPGVNDDDVSINALAGFAASIRNVRQVNLLPYHKTGIAKFKRLRQIYRLENISEALPERLDQIRVRFVAHGLNAKMGG